MRQPRYWTNEVIESHLRQVAGELGHFPTVAELTQRNRGDLANAVSKRGGFLRWSERLGIAREHSDSDTGWDGELQVMQILLSHGYSCERSENIKAPFDLLVDGVLRIDVKSARFATYEGPNSQRSSGWFYRIAKTPQADLILLYQLDTGDFYGLPWWICPTTNVTIARSGGQYASFKNNWPWIRHMIGLRKVEQRVLSGKPVGEVA